MTDEATTAEFAPTTVYSGAVVFDDGSRVSRMPGGPKVIDSGPNAGPGGSIADQMARSVEFHYLDGQSVRP